MKTENIIFVMYGILIFFVIVGILYSLSNSRISCSYDCIEKGFTGGFYQKCPEHSCVCNKNETHACFVYENNSLSHLCYEKYGGN